ncbi:MAG TPA: NAD(P)-binding oxidoreductase [Candidatus Saccharimonadales bacterium]
MKIVVIGASKGIGRQTVLSALDNNHTVTAFSRCPERLKIQHPNLQLQAGNVLDVSAVESAIDGQDVVICALGLPTIQAIRLPFSKHSRVLSTGTRNILSVMATKKVARLICVTAIGAGDSVNQCTPLTRLVLRRGLSWLFQEKDQQEQLIKSSALNWTIIQPTALTNGSKKKTVITKGVRCGIFTQISRADVAAMMIKNVYQPKTYKKAMVLSYPPRVGDSIRWVIGYLGV